MKPNLIARHALLVYFAVSFGFSAVIANVAFSTGNTNISILIPLSPSLLAILVTWIYNNTGGSILSAILIHSTANATFNYLPLLPEWTGQTTTFSIFLGMVLLVVIAVVACYGAANLVR
jgi:hypothetical protein